MLTAVFSVVAQRSTLSGPESQPALAPATMTASAAARTLSLNICEHRSAAYAPRQPPDQTGSTGVVAGSIDVLQAGFLERFAHLVHVQAELTGGEPGALLGLVVVALPGG